MRYLGQNYSVEVPAATQASTSSQHALTDVY